MALAMTIAHLNKNLNADMTMMIVGMVKNLEKKDEEMIQQTTLNNKRVIKQLTHNIIHMKNTHFQAYAQTRGGCFPMSDVCDHFDKIFTTEYHTFYFGKYYENESKDKSKDESDDEDGFVDESDEEEEGWEDEEEDEDEDEE